MRTHRNKDMKRIGGPLKNPLGRLRLDASMAGWQAIELWPETVGERIAARSRAVAFRDGVLVVEVESPTWMSELTYHKRRIIKDLNAKLGGGKRLSGKSGCNRPQRRKKTDEP